MEALNICILKKQIYCEFDNLFITYNVMNDELFIQYITNLTNFYKESFNNIYSTSIHLLEEMEHDYYNNFHIIRLKPIIGKINDVDVLLDILSFFVGKTNSRKFIYS
jgi:hypothetical protein